ncbi:type II toxin-antitoxin system VapC family toxin [Candidatus Poriferisodalis sp.]|uniref:type II toxin-antitoxin system VapC family toxin n=1 Tax=Candidatus Poriferisodalis sp. TaxID=3101277 RepID=UPI003B5CDBF5
MILLDTHVLVWLVAAVSRLGELARNRIQEAWEHGEVAVSAFTFWELAQLRSAGRLELSQPLQALRQRLVADGLVSVPVDDEIALRSVELGDEGFHGDPADRIIVATAVVGGFRLATADREIAAWGDRSSLVTLLDPRV